MVLRNAEAGQVHGPQAGQRIRVFHCGGFLVPRHGSVAIRDDTQPVPVTVAQLRLRIAVALCGGPFEPSNGFYRIDGNTTATEIGECQGYLPFVVTLIGGLAVSLHGTGEILRGARPAFVHRPEEVLGHGISGFRTEREPM